MVKECGEKEYVISVDMGAYIRMFDLDDLNKEPIKYRNMYQEANDNSTWSMDIHPSLPPLLAVGSNSFNISVIIYIQ